MSTSKPQQSPTPQDISNLPQQYKSLWITNKRLQKQIDILNIELSQKDRIIKQLKLQIDSTILEDTKNRLEVIRLVEDQVNQKTKQAKQQFMNKLNNMEIQLDKKISGMFKIQKQLEFQKEQNKIILNRMREFKQHVIIALEEKDLIIQQLTKIVNFQDMETKVQKIKRQALQKYGINQDLIKRQQDRSTKTYRNNNTNVEQKNQNKQKHNKFQTSKVQIKRNI